MKILIPLCLAASLFVAGCAPAPQMNYGPRPVRQNMNGPADRQGPERPQLKRTKNGRYKVTRPWTVRIGGRTWVVQKGYSCNGITAPAKLKGSVGDGVDHPETWAAVFHDWLFTQPGVTRAQADKLFYDLMIAYGVPSGKAKLMHTVVSAYSASKQFR